MNAVLVLIVLTMLQVLFGELLPKSLALQYPTPMALYTVVPMAPSAWVLRPFNAILNGSGTGILRLLGVNQTRHRHVHSPDEIDMLIAQSREVGLLDPAAVGLGGFVITNLTPELEEQVFAWLDVHLKGAPAFTTVSPLVERESDGTLAARWTFGGPGDVFVTNTAYADFPRLSSFLARDSYMPRQFAFRGERLAFTTGIVALSLLAAMLIVIFGASVTALIPLYTLGVFIAFTLSQSGMVMRWLRRREPGWRRGVAINGLGAITTGVIALIVVESKFLSGAWMVVIAIPLFVALLLAIRGHYRDHDATLALARVPEAGEIAPRPIVIVPISRASMSPSAGVPCP